jgi:hypothetical protein
MIRIKCPKCSFTLTLDESLAGQVGQCTECEAKFRIPARKAAAPARPGKDDQVKKKPPSRPAEEDDETDDDGGEDDKPLRAPKKRKSNETAQSVTANIVRSAVFVVVIIVLAVGGMFIHHLAIITMAVSAVLAAACGLMAIKSGTTEPYMPCIGFILLAVMSYFANQRYEDRMVEKRKETKAKIVQVRPGFSTLVASRMGPVPVPGGFNDARQVVVARPPA